MEIFWLILGCTLVTVLPRIVPLMYLSVESLPKSALDWLSFVPVAVMAALLFPDIFYYGGKINLTLNNTALLAAIPSLFISWYTRSFFGTIACAMGCMALLRYLGWQ